MSTNSAPPRPGVQLVPAPAQDRRVLRRLMSLYLHDLSEYTDFLEPGPDGSFTYEGLDLYWRSPSLIPLFIRSGDRLAGFLLLNKPPYTPHDIDCVVHEFFILRADRGRGLGRDAAAACFAQYRGRYRLVQLIRNVPAIGFWHSVYAGLNISYEESRQTLAGESFLVQTFTV
ncbi:MAG TPA: GNAT family N-acetyltransferase [candidate division Zixibacteria bacterium]|nr:GNAT family N-acetyltransferase [candidate division Zixibacteria bacterium]MDD4916223.1 GNAT family N-acetyltransferase [candidate division Zixibacteria bacterium]MDM7972743.1 GNAT family N-acetyltransferase [candidate division Zixibacteria bacterium]HOD67735.1 GNAT family N-acetyltransferase [candidate division Zixibacteria bacterium]HPM37528.1 GNAT family N-acetyltransferase [candidate division Zixibacteria bacterium]